MRGTAILFQEKNQITFLENVDRCLYDEIKDQDGNANCTCKINNQQINFGNVTPAFWHDDDIDWDYGY